MIRDITDCDRCGAGVEEAYDHREGFAIPIPTGNHPLEYRTEERRLCDDCRVALLEFIDGDGEATPDRSDLIGGRLRADVARDLAALSSQAKQTAEAITEGGKDGDE